MDRTHSFGYWLRRRRKALDLTQAELARCASCSLDLIQKIEADARRPSRQMAQKLAEVLGVDASERAAFVQAARAERSADQLALPEQPVEPPQRSTSTNLPAQLTTLIGREQAVGTVTGMLRRAGVRLVTLSGPGGIGKTRLGLQVAEELLDDFAHGVYFVDLATIREPDLVIGQIATTLGVKESGTQPLLASLKAYLHDKQMLLLLDNFEQVIQAAPVVAELLGSAPQLKLLVTSREVLKLRGEKEFTVPPLALPLFAGDRPPLANEHASVRADAIRQYAAVALFIERALDIRPDFELNDANAPAVAEICAQLDGLPLAIELAAARLKLFTPEALLGRLSSRLALLSGGPRDLPARQETIRNTIAWSYDLLNQDEQTLFRRLGVFVGGWTLDAAEQVLRTEGQALSDRTSNSVLSPRYSVLEGMAALLDKSLIHQKQDGDTTRFTMLETIREYALERLEASGEAEQVRRQHIRYYLSFRDNQPGEDDDSRERRVGRDYENVRSALEWSLRTAGDLEVALQLADALISVWYERGLRNEAIVTLQRILDHPRGVGRTPAHASARERLAQLFTLTGNYRAAQAEYEQALPLARELGDTVWCGSILEGLGWLAREQGNSATAWVWLSEAIAIFRQLEEAQSLAWALTTAAELANLDEDAARAEALLAESRTLWGNDGSKNFSLRWAWMLNHLGHAAQLRGDYQRAAELHQESIAHFRTLADQHFGLVWAYHSLGETELGLERPGEAVGWLAQGLALSQTLGDQASVAWCLAGIGSTAALDEEPERAARLWGAAERLRQSIGCRAAPAARATYERAMAQARAQLGEEAFAAAWAAGQALALEQAIAGALENDRAT